MTELKEKVVLITGASIGIGSTTAKEFAKENCKLVLTYRSHKKEAEQLAKECKELGATDMLLVELDVLNDNNIRNCVKQTVDKFKKIDILINNAGVIAWKKFKDQTFEEIEQQVRVNLEGLIKMTSAALPHIKESIINISSGAGKHAHPTLSTYCATKWGVRGFTQTIAKEHPELHIYSVNPDMTKTAMTNFEGRPAEDVAKIIVNTAKGKIQADKCDVDVWEVSEKSFLPDAVKED